MNQPAFARYVGINYSGAETPTASLEALRVYLAEGDASPIEVSPASPRRYWSRRGIAEWLVERLAENAPTLVGIDHGFSFPLRYFEAHGLEPTWLAFLDDFARHWPTDEDHAYVDFVREGVMGDGAARMGQARWRRLTEMRAGGPRSVFRFAGPGAVGKSAHAGIPWLRFIRRRLPGGIHFWPFDGWDIPAGGSALVEVYPALWRRTLAREDRTADQHDAFCIAAGLARADRGGTLPGLLKPDLRPAERTVAEVEGWILGVPGLIRKSAREDTVRPVTPDIDVHEPARFVRASGQCSPATSIPTCRRPACSGIIKHAKAINAFSNPTTNSYKRLVPGFEAAVQLACSARNRSASWPASPTPPNPKAKRVEVRFPDPLANPYLAFAAMLMAGLDGYPRTSAIPGSAMDKDLYDLPPKELKKIPTVCGSLREALLNLDKDRDFLKAGGVFDDDFIDSYIELKMTEVISFEHTPHPVEYVMYYSA